MSIFPIVDNRSLLSNHFIDVYETFLPTNYFTAKSKTSKGNEIRIRKMKKEKRKEEKLKKKRRKTEKDVFLFESETLAISQRVFFQKQTLRQDQFLNAMFINEKY